MTAAGGATPRTVTTLGVDVGGTFTDAVLVGPGGLTIEKVLSEPRQERGVVAAVEAVLARAGVGPADVDAFVHGSTVATNALLERKGARTAFVATAGFKDVLHLGRQARPSLYRLADAPPAPVVPRELCFEVRERCGPEGELEPLDEDGVRAVAAELRAHDVEAVAVCFLHAYAFPEHEARAAAILRELLPGVVVVASHETAAEFREYERATTTTLDAYLAPAAGRYLEGLAGESSARGLPEPLVMLSNGGVTTVANAARRPASLLLSGPAGGVTAVRLLARELDCLPAIGFDMGGTSCDAFMLSGLEPELTADRRVAGLPVRVPMADIHTVGAGGGSLAWVDPGGALRVGPESAGAHPGPASYGRGGTAATVTDANLLLGYLPADVPIAGGVRLDLERARDAVAEVARAGGFASVEEAARGIVDVADHHLVRALRVVSVERGHDPADCTVVAFGGAGPLHVCAVTDLLGARRAVCVPASGVLSALGLALADHRVDRSRTLLRPLAELTPADLRHAVDALGAPPAGMEVDCALDLRYAGQSFELTVPFSPGEPLAAVAERFHEAHERRYGHAAATRAVECVTVRAALTAPGPQAGLAGLLGRPGSGEVVRGPAIVALEGSTCLVAPGWVGRWEAGVLLLERA